MNLCVCAYVCMVCAVSLCTVCLHRAFLFQAPAYSATDLLLLRVLVQRRTLHGRSKSSTPSPNTYGVPGLSAVHVAIAEGQRMVRARTHARTHTHTHTHTCAKCILASLCAVWPEGKAVCADCAVACGHRFGLPVASCLGYVSAGLGAWPGCGAAEVRGSSVRELKAVHAGTMPSHPLVGPLCPKGGTEPIKRLSLISSSLDLDRASAPHAASVR